MTVVPLNTLTRNINDLALARDTHSFGNRSDLVTVRAKLIYTGSSSMHFAVDVLACDLKDRHERLATSCVIVFVALDSPDGKPTAVAPWAPQTPEDKRLAEYAERMMGLSKAMERQVAEFKGQPAPP